MNKQLLNTSPSKGFTLIELMVAIAIIAILSAVGLTIFTGSQKAARDSKRRQDLEAIAKALEANYLPTANGTCKSSASQAPISTTPGYCPVDTIMFAGNKIPQDPLGSAQIYCMSSANSSDPIPDLATWTDKTTCPASWYPVTNGSPTATEGFPYNTFKICTYLENQNQILCVGSQQN